MSQKWTPYVEIKKNDVSYVDKLLKPIFEDFQKILNAGSGISKIWKDFLKSKRIYPENFTQLGQKMSLKTGFFRFPENPDPKSGFLC